MKGGPMFITALCPTYRHPELLANSLWLWNQQSYPANRRRLIIFDDDQTFVCQEGSNWELHSSPFRWPSLPAKYNTMLGWAPQETEAFLVWDDDDIYLPDYIVSHVRILEEQLFSKPSHVYSDYPKQLVVERADGRFHSSIGFRKELIDELGGYPDTHRPDFDQTLITNLTSKARGRIGSPWGSGSGIQYIYSWHTGAAHCQHTIDAPDSKDWYDRAATSYEAVEHVGQLEARQDLRTAALMKLVAMRDE